MGSASIINNKIEKLQRKLSRKKSIAKFISINIRVGQDKSDRKKSFPEFVNCYVTTTS